MWFGEPHSSPSKRITYQTERVGTTKLQKGDRVDRYLQLSLSPRFHGN